MTDKWMTIKTVGKELDILYVEDEESLRCQTANFLTKIFNNVQTAPDGEAGLNYFREKQFDLVITDIQMPHLNGLDMIARIKEINPDIKIIVTTAFGDQAYMVRAIDLGVDSYLTKPVDMDRFVEVLNKTLGAIRYQKEIEKRNQENRELRRLMEQAERGAKIGSFELDLVTNKITFSVEMYRIFEFENGIQVDTEMVLARYHAEDREKVSNNLHSLLEGTKHLESTKRILLPDGREKYIQTIIDSYEDENGKVVKLVGTSQDVTEKMRYESLEREHENMLYQQDKLKAMNELLRNIAHHWRQPLNAIGLQLGLIEDYVEFREFDKMADVISRIKKQNHFLSETIRYFNDFSKEDKNELETDILQMFEEVRYLVFADLEEHHIDITAYSEIKKPVILMANETKRIVYGLVNNAKEAIEERVIKDAGYRGKIELIAESSDHRLFLKVRDNGHGLAPEIIDRVFEPYFTTKFQSRGVGLSLYLFKKTIENEMKGSLYANRDFTGGAEFTIELPLKQLT